MTRNTRSFLLGLIVTLSGAFAQEHPQRTAQDVFRLLRVSGGVHALYGRGGTVGFFVGEDAVFVVDAQFEDIAPGIVEQIRKVTGKPIKYLLNTHHHVDHVGGNVAFRPFALIIAHDNVRKRMLASPAEILREYPARLEEAQKSNDASAAKFFSEQMEWARKVKVEEIAAPLLTFDSEFRIHLDGETIQIWHTPPAHTDGDSVVYFENAKVLHAGDLYWNRVVPFIDVQGGGSVRGYLTALDKVLSRVPEEVKVIPGHGEVSDLTGLRRFRKYIADVLETARQAKAAGKSKEDFLRDVSLPDYQDYPGYPKRFRENCAAAFDEIR